MARLASLARHGRRRRGRVGHRREYSRGHCFSGLSRACPTRYPRADVNPLSTDRLRMLVMGPEQPAAGAAALVGPRRPAAGEPRLARRTRRLSTGAVVAEPHNAAAWEGLGRAARHVDDLEASRAAFEQAYRDYLDARDNPGAAPRGDGDRALSRPVSRGTCGRQRLVRSARGAPRGLSRHLERAWLMLWRAHVHIHVRDEMPAGREALQAHSASTSAARWTRSTRWPGASAGLALISDGDVEGGLRRLDEATAMAIAGDRFLAGDDRTSRAATFWRPAQTVRDFEPRAAVAGYAWSADRPPGVPHCAGFCRSPLRGHPDVVRQLPGRGIRRSTRCARRSRRSRRPDVPLRHPPGECAAGKADTRTQSGCCSPPAAHPLALLPLAWLRPSTQTTLMARSAWSSATSAAPAGTTPAASTPLIHRPRRVTRERRCAGGRCVWRS